MMLIMHLERHGYHLIASYTDKPYTDWQVHLAAAGWDKLPTIHATFCWSTLCRVLSDSQLWWVGACHADKGAHGDLSMNGMAGLQFWPNMAAV